MVPSLIVFPTVYLKDMTKILLNYVNIQQFSLLIYHITRIFEEKTMHTCGSEHLIDISKYRYPLDILG
jgi:hypothetical protein